MTKHKIPAVFIRGGTSKGVYFKEQDLPASREERDQIFLQVLGSPDPYQRQLNGMGGGISSLSKAVIVSASERPDADVDYTFIQVAVDKPIAEYGQACGNLSSGVGPFAVEEGIIDVVDGPTTVRVYSTNTEQIYHAHFETKNGCAVEVGDYEMAGVAGLGAKVRLDYLDPGGSKSPAFISSGNVTDTVHLRDQKDVTISLVDATNPVVFVEAGAMGITGRELPELLEANLGLMKNLDIIRRQAGVLMKIADNPEDVPLSSPKIALVSSPSTYTTISGVEITEDDYDIAVRIVSMERMHKAVTGTGGMCLAAACQVTGTLPNILARSLQPGQDIRIGTPSGVMVIAAQTSQDEDGVWSVERVTAYRTQRRLMEGFVVLPRS